MTENVQTPMTLIAPTDTINVIVDRHPDALPVLHAFGLDSCCGGALPLEVAIAHHGLNLADVLIALQEKVSEAVK